MRIIDISRELFSAERFPGDPEPRLTKIASIGKDSDCNLSELSLCVHNGTHLDAQAHFIKNGATAESVPLCKTIGPAEVVEASGEIGRELAEKFLCSGARRLLIKGRIAIGLDAAAVFASRLDLLGTEELTVGRRGEVGEAHRILLGAGVVLLENVDLSGAMPARYTLFAAPLKINGAEGAPVRAVLLEE